MPASLSPSTKKNILQAGSEVYFSYLFLDMLSSNYYVSKGHDFDLNGAKTSIKTFITTLIKEGKTQADFMLGKRACHIELTPMANREWSIVISNSNSRQATSLKPIDQFQADDFLNFCERHPFKVSQDNTGNYKFSTELQHNGKTLTLGGPDKLDLYQLHISNLYTILTRVADEHANMDILVSMATGSGKSFTQALWYLVLHLAGNSCLFAVPNESLVAQLKRDFERLLPAIVTQHVPAIQSNAHLPQQAGLKWGIMSHQNLLQNHWQFLQSEESKKSELFLCLDEEHIATQEELYSKRVQTLGHHYPTMFLSATPSEKAYQICGGRPVASLSRQEKEALGIAKPAVSKHVQTKGTIAKTRKSKSLSAGKKMIIGFVNSIEKERRSTAHEYADQSETMVTFRKKTDPFYEKANGHNIKRFMRWNIHSPLGEKALVLTDRHDPVINLNLLSAQDAQNPYKKGNRIYRENVYDFFQLGPNLDEQCFKHHNEAKQNWRRKQFLQPLKENFKNLSQKDRAHAIEHYVDFGDTGQYMKHRVLHGLIENTLSFLLKIDSNQLDYLRFNHFDKLTEEVRTKLGALPKQFGSHSTLNSGAVYVQIKNSIAEDNLPKEIADEVALALVHMIQTMERCSKNDLELFVDNWQLDKQLHDFNFNNTLTQFIDKYKTVFIVNGLEKSPSAVQANKPFFNLLQQPKPMDHESVRKNELLRHKLSPLEALDDTTQQAIYVPNYCPKEYTPAVIDTLFRKGLIGTYITSEKVTGFNDAHLHHLCMLVDDKEDPMNAPDNIIQGSGRNRGLNPARQPFYFLVNERKTPAGFSPSILEKKDYYPEFFTAKNRHHKQLTKSLGNKIALQIKEFIDVQLNPDSTVDTQAMELKLRDIILNEFEELYKNNKFHFKKSRKLFAAVLADTYKDMYAQSKAMKKTYSIPLLSRFIAGFLNFIATIHYYLFTAGSHRSFVSASKKLKNMENEKVYTRIIRSLSYKKLIKTGVPAKRFRDIFEESTEKALQFALEKQPLKSLKPEIATELENLFINHLSPYFIRYVGTNQQQLSLLKLIASKKNWLVNAFDKMDDIMNVDTYFSVIKTDPEIAAFLANNKLIIETDRPELAFETFNNLMEDIKKTAEENPFDFDEIVQQASDLFSNRLEQLQFLFTPKDFAFLIVNKDNLNFNVNVLPEFNLDQVDDSAIPKTLITILRHALPTKVLQQADSEGLLCPDDYDLSNKMDQMKLKFSNLATVFDMNAVRDQLAQNLERYIKSPSVKKIFHTVLKPFNSSQLKTLLDAMYPQGSANPNDNATKVTKLLGFKKDLGTLSTKDILRKYASFTDPDDIEKTDLRLIFNWISDIYDEILNCQCHWHAMGEKGDFLNERPQPKLRTQSMHHDHRIWSKYGTKNESVLTGIAKKNLFLKATLDAFPEMNRVENLKNHPLRKVLEETAEVFVKPLSKTLKKESSKLKHNASKHQHTLFKSAQQLGKIVHKAKSLTPSEVVSAETHDLNAVQKIRRSY